MYCLVNSVTLSGKSGASSGKAEDEGVAGSYVEDENAARGVIWLAGTHGYLRDTTLAELSSRIVCRTALQPKHRPATKVAGDPFHTLF